MIELAENNAKEAGFPDTLRFKQIQISDFSTEDENGVVIGNPPYGERMKDKSYAENLYRDLGRVLRPMDTWSVYIITSHPHFEKFYGAQATKKRKLYNGNIKTDFYQFWGKRPKRK